MRKLKARKSVVSEGLANAEASSEEPKAVTPEFMRKLKARKSAASEGEANAEASSEPAKPPTPEFMRKLKARKASTGELSQKPAEEAAASPQTPEFMRKLKARKAGATMDNKPAPAKVSRALFLEDALWCTQRIWNRKHTETQLRRSRRRCARDD